MKGMIFFLAMALTVTIGLAYTCTPPSKRGLPEARPAVFAIEHETVGNDETGRSVQIGGHRNLIMTSHRGIDSTVEFQVSGQALDALWKVCREQHLETIRQVVGTGGLSPDQLRLEAGRRVIVLAGAAVDPRDRARYDAIVEAIDDLVVEAMTATLTVDVGASLVGHELTIALVDRVVTEGTIDAAMVIEIPVIPGPHIVRFEVDGGEAQTLELSSYQPVEVWLDGERLVIRP